MTNAPTETAARILEKAAVAFARYGFDGVSMRDVAQACDISPGLLTYHFPKKSDLFHACVAGPYERLVGELRALVDDRSVPALTRLDRVIARLAATNDAETNVVRTVFREVFTAPEHLKDIAPMFLAGHIALLFRLVQDLVAEGAIPPELGPGLLPLIMGGTVLPRLIATSLGDAVPHAVAEVLMTAAPNALRHLLGVPR